MSWPILAQPIYITNRRIHPWHFQSGYYDASTGLYKFGVRYYDPTVGRWTQADPIGGSIANPASTCRYCFAQDDLVNLSDPTERDTFGYSQREQASGQKSKTAAHAIRRSY